MEEGRIHPWWRCSSFDIEILEDVHNVPEFWEWTAIDNSDEVAVNEKFNQDFFSVSRWSQTTDLPYAKRRWRPCWRSRRDSGSEVVENSARSMYWNIVTSRKLREEFRLKFPRPIRSALSLALQLHTIHWLQSEPDPVAK